MPGHFEFDKQNKILLLVAEGDIQDGEILNGKYIIAQAVRLFRPLAGITDLSSVTKFDVSADVMRTAARQPSPYPPDVPSFLIAPKGHIFGMARMYEFFGPPTRTNLKVLHSVREALDDLGLKSAEFTRVDFTPELP